MVVSDTPGALLNTDMDDNIHMLSEGTVAETIIKLYPTIYKKTHVVKETWEANVIHTVTKALYGTLQSALLFWKLLSETLQK